VVGMGVGSEDALGTDVETVEGATVGGDTVVEGATVGGAGAGRAANSLVGVASDAGTAASG